jgi:hypothetical protein
LLRPVDKTGANRVQLNVTQAGVEMRFVHRKGSEAALPEIAAPALTLIDLPGIAAVGRRQSAPKPVRAGRDEDRMDVVRHDAPGPERRPAPSAPVTKQAEIEPEIGVDEERPLLAIAALGHVVRNPGKNQAGGARHVTNLIGNDDFSQQDFDKR